MKWKLLVIFENYTENRIYVNWKLWGMKMTEENYEKLTPFELGETGDKDALDQLKHFLENGTITEKRLAASAVQKISKKYNSEAKKLVIPLLNNLCDSAPQVRQYSLNALREFDLDADQLEKVGFIAQNDEKEYNRLAAERLMAKQSIRFPLQKSIIETFEERNIVSQDPELNEISNFNPSSTKALKNREKDMYLFASENVEKYSANYSRTNDNFVIQNNAGDKLINSSYFPVICILKNILMRGCPTIMSTYLQDKLGAIHMTPGFNEVHPLISREMPKWHNTIKGDKINNYYPAITFIENIIPKYLPQHKYIQQLIIPEVSFDEMTLISSKTFEKQQVDFYLPQAKLVIEIDGQAHKRIDLNRINDEERIEYLQKFGITTIRIETVDIRNESVILKEKMREIEIHLEKFSKELKDYRKALYSQKSNVQNYEINLKATAIIRFQILILSLLEKGKLCFEDSEWKFSVIERDIRGFEILAIKDLFLRIKNLSILLKLDFKEPKFYLKINDSLSSKIDENYINIDFSLLSRWTDENDLDSNKNRIYVRTDYFDKNNYFVVSTFKPIKYNIINDGENSDIKALEFFLKNIFKFSTFNSGQLSVITNALKGEDTIGLLPTGGGKSLIYQFVALLQPCISFIVVPIKSLMKDQRDNLDKLYISNSNYINSSQEAEEKSNVQIEFAHGKYQFVWISPERFQTNNFRQQLQNINDRYVIGMAVIDEVHCLSEWGHDFRTSYLNLAKTIRKYCKNAQILGLTATASIYVLKDILIEFEIDNKNVKTLPSFTRPELTFQVIKDDGLDDQQKERQLIELLKTLNEKRQIFQINGSETRSGIIFTKFVSKKKSGCYDLSNILRNEFKVDVRWYSGSIPEISKKPIMKDKDFNIHNEQVQSDFQDNLFPLLVATKAFGMGIDKSNVRYTIHYGIPGSIEALYQEGGRAGRDKKPARCYVLFSEGNIGKNYFDMLFGLKSSVSDIEEAQSIIKYKGRDAMDNIYLWLKGVKGIEKECKEILEFYKTYVKPKVSQLTIGKRLNLSKQELERVIYKLSLIGITNDWMIEDWSAKNSKIRVYFNDFSEESIEGELVKYIRKYDKEFDLNKKMDENGIELEYHNIYSDKSISLIEKAIRVLLIWQYENVAYNRRQSISTVYDQCKINHDNSKALKEFMESYFRFSDEAYTYDYLVENPRAYKYWFTTFFDKNDILISYEKLNENKAALRRFLESIRYNTGLNFVSGLIHLLTNEYNKDDGRARFEMAISSLKEYEQIERQEIFSKLFLLSKHMTDKNKEYLSETLIKQFPEKSMDIYHNVKDNFSLDYILEDFTKRIGKLTRGLT